MAITKKKLSVLRFSGPDKEWLRYVVMNRSGIVDAAQYDLVIGPVANDRTIRTVNDFMQGYLTEEIAIQLLFPQKLKDQFACKSENAIRALTYLGARYE